MTGATGPAGGATGATGGSSRGATGATGGTGPIDPRLRNLKVPEKYAAEPWAKEIRSVDDLWDKMKGAQKLIGKDKIVLPGEGATKEEMDAFYTRMGRPANPEGYVFQSIDALKEVERNINLDHGMKKIFHDEGIPKVVGERIVSKYEALMYDMHKPMLENSAKREMDFQRLSNEVLGPDKSTAIEAFKSVMKETLGDKAHLASKIENMSNEELLPLIVFSKNIHDKYTGENRVNFRPGDPAGATGDLKTDFQTLSTQKLTIKQDTKMPEHIKKQRLMNINLQMQKIGVKAGEKGIDLFA